MEFVKEREKHEAALSLLPRDPVRQEPVNEDTRLECVRRCLQALAPESSQLIMAYYQDDGRNKIPVRKKLTQHLPLSPHTLSMSLHRLTTNPEECPLDS